MVAVKDPRNLLQYIQKLALIQVLEPFREWRLHVLCCCLSFLLPFPPLKDIIRVLRGTKMRCFSFSYLPFSLLVLQRDFLTQQSLIFRSFTIFSTRKFQPVLGVTLFSAQSTSLTCATFGNPYLLPWLFPKLFLPCFLSQIPVNAFVNLG